MESSMWPEKDRTHYIIEDSLLVVGPRLKGKRSR